ncbi:hypothetical protein AB0I39_30495 [Kitasatospora purpeofusca]|uniref:DUF7507 domain-containing protein n=1 Tax=Kitasatospora purpeofusca TaxID=67352 RepID=UPI0033DF9C70
MGTAVVSMLAATLCLGPLIDAPAAGAAVSECATDPGFDHCVAFGYAGGDRAFTVPAGVSAVTAKVWGAGSGVVGGLPGVPGDYATAVLPVTGGDVLIVRPGPGGVADGSGAASGTAGTTGGPGGRSEVRLATSAGDAGTAAPTGVSAPGGTRRPSAGEPAAGEPAAVPVPRTGEPQYIAGTAAGGRASVAHGAGGNGLVVLQWHGPGAGPGAARPVIAARAASPTATVSAAPSGQASPTSGPQPSWSAATARATGVPTPDGDLPGPGSAPRTRPGGRVVRAPGDPLDCTGRVVYAYQRGASATSDGTLLALTVSTLAGPTPAAVTATAVSTLPGAGFANALGISSGGTAAYLVDQTPTETGTVHVHGLDVATGTWTTYTGSATGPTDSFVAGAVDPANGIYYYANYFNGVATLYGFDTTTHTAIPGIVATFPLPITAVGGSNGDLAFDAAGNLYALSSLGTTAAIGRVDGPLPTTGSATGTPLTSTTISAIDNPAANSYNGIAFDNAGHLFVEYTDGVSTTYVKELDPNGGAVIEGPKPYSDNTFLSVDLGACSTNPTLELQKDVVGRFASSASANDQFTLAVTGGGVTGATATTTGTATGVQPVTVGPLIALSGTNYTLGESAASGSLGNYTTTYTCVDTANGGTPVTSGTGTGFTLPFPATVSGLRSPSVLCTFRNTPVDPNPALTIVKSVDATDLTVAGQVLHYTFVVTNTGNVTLTDVTVTETKFTGSGPAPVVTCPAGAAALAPVASVTCTASYTVIQDDIDRSTLDNTAVATGTPPSGPPVTSPPSSTTVPNTPAPAVTLVKSVDPQTVSSAGQTVAYSFVVTNTGNVTLANVSVADTAFSGAGAPPSITCPPAAARVVPGASVTCTASYTVVQADIDAGSVTNTAVANGTPPTGPPVASPPSNAVVTAPPAPALTLVKSAEPQTVGATGASVAYSFVVTNTGNVTLTNVSVTDTAFSGSGPAPVVTCPAGAASLAPGASVTCTAPYTVVQADIDAGSVTNTAVANGTPPTGPPVASPPSNAVVIAMPTPALTVVKSVDAGKLTGAGQVLTYSFMVTNTGNVTLTNVSVTDTAFSGSGPAPVVTCPAGAASLAPGASVTCTAPYTVVQADIDRGTVENTAVATGTPPSGPPVTSPPSSTTVPDTPAPAITLVKSADPGTVATAGASVAYSFVVTNTGNVTLTNVSVTDTAFSGSGPAPVVTCPAGAASLAPGASVTCTAPYTVTGADLASGRITNTAVATGTPPGGGTPVNSPPSSAVVTTVAPSPSPSPSSTASPSPTPTPSSSPSPSPTPSSTASPSPTVAPSPTGRPTPSPTTAPPGPGPEHGHGPGNGTGHGTGPGSPPKPLPSTGLPAEVLGGSAAALAVLGGSVLAARRRLRRGRHS